MKTNYGNNGPCIAEAVESLLRHMQGAFETFGPNDGIKLFCEVLKSDKVRETVVNEAMFALHQASFRSQGEDDSFLVLRPGQAPVHFVGRDKHVGGVHVVDLVPENRCVFCGCTDSRPCPKGCGWYVLDVKRKFGVCSSCLTPLSLFMLYMHKGDGLPEVFIRGVQMTRREIEER